MPPVHRNARTAGVLSRDSATNAGGTVIVAITSSTNAWMNRMGRRKAITQLFEHLTGNSKRDNLAQQNIRARNLL